MNLCVVTKDVALDSVSLDDSQSGVLLNLSDKKVLYAKGALQQGISCQYHKDHDSNACTEIWKHG